MIYTPSKKGFTLVEVVFVVSIVATLSLVVYSSVNEMRKRSRDTARVTDLQTLQLALKMHRDGYGTYLVSSTGLNNTGTGWISYTGTNYTKSITQGLYEEGLIPQATFPDPMLDTQGYVLFLCNSGKSYGLFARKERPVTAETEAMSSLCGGAAAAAAPYNMNFGIGG